MTKNRFRLTVLGADGARNGPLQGRSSMQVNATKSGAPTSSLKLAKAARRFDRLPKKAPKAACLAGEDPVRAEMNEAVSEMPGVSGYGAATLTRPRCAEPGATKLKSGRRAGAPIPRIGSRAAGRDLANN